MNKRKKLSFKQGLLFGVITIVVFAIVLELGLRVLLYQRYVPNPVALQHTYIVVRDRVQKWLLHQEVKRTGKKIDYSYRDLSEMTGIHYDRDPASMREELVQYLYKEPGKQLLAEFHKNYELLFAQIANEAKSAGREILIMYLPMGRPEREEKSARSFYSKLAAKYNAGYLDVSDRLKSYKGQYTRLVPQDNHLSRFGNIIVAEELAKSLKKYDGHRSTHQYPDHERPEVMGDKEANSKRILDHLPNMAYREVINAQGFRMVKDLSFSKTQQRILVLGDSYTEGPFLPNYHTYCGFLTDIFPDKDIINAGVGSYSIQDQAELYMDRARYAEADMIVLQVLDNDISDMFYFYRNFNNRAKIKYKPTEKELQFFELVKNTEKN